MTGQSVVCPGRCGWHVTYDVAALQALLNDEPAVLNGVVEPVRAIDVVEAVLLGHLAACAPLQQHLDARARPWRRALRWDPLRRPALARGGRP